MNQLQNEGGEGCDHTADTSALEAEYNTAKDAEFASEWTAEVTAERRAAWNTAAKLFKSYKEQRATEAAMGFIFEDLKKAVTMHN